MNKFTRTEIPCLNCAQGHLLVSTEDGNSWKIECDDCSYISEEDFRNEEHALDACEAYH